MQFKEENVTENKSFDFAVRIVNAYKYLSVKKREFVLSKQLLRAGTSIGANVSEAVQAQSRKDFLSKINIALKEANETEYWLRLLFKTEYLSTVEFESIHSDCVELEKLLVSIVKTTKRNIENQNNAIENFR
jgi:four helix bundle protein